MHRFIVILLAAVSCSLLSAEEAGKGSSTPGKLIFATIQRLPEKWWKNRDTVWNTWNKDAYYLWGANLRNFKIFDPDKLLKGSGMASVEHGPTRGRGHPHYIGVITTSLSYKQNDCVFKFLEKKLKSGSNIVIPVYEGKYALGTGVAYKRHACKKNWYKSQKYLFEKFLALADIAKEVVITEGTFWPDCAQTMSSESPTKFPIRNTEDIKKILPYLDWKIN